MLSLSVHKRPRPHFPLDELLKKRGVTQYELARRCRMTPQYIGDLYRGKHQPSWTIVCLIASALGATLGDFAPAPPAGAKAQPSPRSHAKKE